MTFVAVSDTIGLAIYTGLMKTLRQPLIVRT